MRLQRTLDRPSSLPEEGWGIRQDISEESLREGILGNLSDIRLASKSVQVSVNFRLESTCDVEERGILGNTEPVVAESPLEIRRGNCLNELEDGRESMDETSVTLDLLQAMTGGSHAGFDYCRYVASGVEQLNYLVPTIGSRQCAESVMSHVGSLQFVDLKHFVPVVVDDFDGAFPPPRL